MKKLLFLTLFISLSTFAYDTRTTLNDSSLHTVYTNHFSFSNKPSDIYKFIDGNNICYIAYGNGHEESISCVKEN